MMKKNHFKQKLLLWRQAPFNITETSSFTDTYTNRTCKTNHLFNCSGKSLVYLLTCQVCLQQYVGQTVDEFQNRWNDYKSNDRKYLNRQSCLQEHFFENFNVDGHSGFLENVSITFIDKIDHSDPRKNSRKLLDPNTKDHGSLRFKCFGKQWLIKPRLL